MPQTLEARVEAAVAAVLDKRNGTVEALIAAALDRRLGGDGRRRTRGLAEETWRVSIDGAVSTIDGLEAIDGSTSQLLDQSRKVAVEGGL